ncbi:hypothetical protein FZEAL_10527 [Fusarium zealandicum]|uniref:Myb transcription factor n=1 Tax=Fusarium zealandicum TaxID=1053134 RepID=A0A8H4U0E5_9HYPO|nr:hypothetical protein FZEAL_10527 [Fusarium zealandicum]
MSSNGTGNSKWPDFRLASTLWSLMGSQSNGPDKQTPTDRPENHEHDLEEQHINQERDGELPELHGADYAMMDPEGHPIDGLGGFDNFGHDAQVDTEEGVQDQDFGALEMFDSNATQAPYSSEANETPFDPQMAPEAVMSEVPSSHTKKSKRDKKDRKKKGTNTDSASPQPLAEEESSRKLRKSKRKPALPVEIPDSLAENNTSTEAQLPEISAINLNEEATVPLTQTKRKRKPSGSAEGKQRKKRRPQDEDEGASQDVVQGTQEGEELVPADELNTRDSQAASFLRTRNASRPAAIYDDIAEDAPKSPSHVRLQSRETRPIEDGVIANAHPDEMEVDAPAAQLSFGDAADRYPGTSSFVAINGLDNAMTADHDVENLAREAWNEHLNGQAHPESQEIFSQPDEMEIPTSAQRPQNARDVYDVPPSPTQDSNPPSSLKRTRSAKAKKAKPTYFDKSPSPEVSQQNDLPALPSPSAMTPKPRNRNKRASKRKKPEADRALLSQSMQGGDDEPTEDADAPQGRRNRMAGYTTGRFSDEELSRIARVVEAYRVEHNMAKNEVNAMIHAPGGTTAGDDHAALWGRIFSTCPDRHRQKIINITRKKFHNFIARGTWTPEQDAELRDLIEVHGTKWSKIAGIINRHPEDLRDRYRNYIVCGDAQRKDSWDEREEGNLTRYVMEAMAAIDELRMMEPSRELLKKPYEELIDWQNVSERMERTRSRLQCITKWKAMNIKTHGKDKLASQQPDASISFRLEKARRQIVAMPDEERYRLVMAIQGSPALVESKIPWQRLVDKQFRNNWHRPTQMLLWRRLKHSVPDWEQKSVRDCAQYLVDLYSQAGELPNIDDVNFNDAQEMEFLDTIPTVSFPNASGNAHNASNGDATNGDASGAGNHISAEFVGASDVEDEPEPKMDDYGVPDENIQPDLPVEPMDHIETAAPLATMEPLAPVTSIEAAEVAEPAGIVKPTATAETVDPTALGESAQIGELVEASEPAEFVEPAPPKATRTAKRTGMGKAKAPKAPKPPRKSTAKSTPAKPTPARRVSRRNVAPSQDPIEDDAVALPAADTEETSEIDEARPRKRKTPSKFRSTAPTEETRYDDSDSVMDDMEDLPARVAV